MAIAITICRFCMVVLLVFLPAQCAPRSKSRNRVAAPQTVYDQKQTGDYNIQLHLKDFQIIALLGDDYFGGDYDYNYDYSDFTLKPSTPKPSTEAALPSSSSAQPPTSPAPEKLSSTSKPLIAVTNSTSPSEESPIINKQEQPIITDKTSEKPSKQEANEVEKLTSSNATEAVVEIVESSTVPQREKYQEPNSPGKIKVQIIETPVGVVPGEMPEKDGAFNHGEIQHGKRCATGFSRDKLGRCRRFRRPSSGTPHLPYGFSRLANNLASRLRYKSSEESLPSSESTED